MENKKHKPLIIGLIIAASAIVLLFGALVIYSIFFFKDDDTDVERGLAGKKGKISDEEDDSSMASEDLSKVEVYNGHLDTVILIYMVGSNLESANGLGTTDLHEIGAAIKANDPGAATKIIVETGGSKSWGKDFPIDPDKIGRYEVGADEVILKEEHEVVNMSKPDTLANFIKWGMTAYPADRYGLILWNHGGGTMRGFGADELFSGSMMRLQQLKQALESSGAHFAFVGFDACLMGTVETAYMLSPFADYMIASEEMEPGNGWDYTNWVDMLMKDPKTSVEDFGKQIIDDFAASNEKSGDVYTLSLIDLGKIGELYNALLSYADTQNKAIVEGKYSDISKARSDARSFGHNKYEQVDIIDFVDKAGLDGKDEIKKAIEDSVSYFKTNMKGANGIAMYYPCNDLENYERTNKLLAKLDFDKAYRDSLSGFCTVMSQSDDDTKSGSGYADEDWYRSDLARSYEGETQIGLEEHIPYTTLPDGTMILDMTYDQLKKMTYIGVEVYVNNEDGTWCQMGADLFQDSVKDENGDEFVNVSFDSSWLMINGTFAPYFYQDVIWLSDNSMIVYGYATAVLNDDTPIWIRVEFVLPEDSVGYTQVCGYWELEENGDIKGGGTDRDLLQFKEGDKLTFATTMVHEDTGETEGVEWGDPIYVPEEGLTATYGYMQDSEFMFCYILEDVYKNSYYTDYVSSYDLQ